MSHRKYSPQGRLHASHYMYKHKTTDGNEYSFIAVDSCPQPGPRRPFNFFGVLNQVSILSLSAVFCIDIRVSMPQVHIDLYCLGCLRFAGRLCNS